MKGISCSLLFAVFAAAVGNGQAVLALNVTIVTLVASRKSALLHSAADAFQEVLKFVKVALDRRNWVIRVALALFQDVEDVLARHHIRRKNMLISFPFFFEKRHTVSSVAGALLGT